MSIINNSNSNSDNQTNMLPASSINPQGETYMIRLHTKGATATGTNTRLVTISWKAPKSGPNKGKEAHAARNVSIPRTTLVVSPSILAESMNAAFGRLQDQVIRSIMEAAFDNGKNPLNIAAADITPAAVATYYQQQKSTSGHLSSDSIEAWFEDDLTEILSAAFAEQLAFPNEPDAAQVAKLNTIVLQHKNAFKALASPRSNYDETVISQLELAANLADDSAIREKILTKLTTMKQPAKIMIALGLGSS